MPSISDTMTSQIMGQTLEWLTYFHQLLKQLVMGVLLHSPHFQA